MDRHSADDDDDDDDDNEEIGERKREREIVKRWVGNGEKTAGSKEEKDQYICM